MLHFAAGISFGVDIADFLQLERAFQRQREVRAAAQVQHVTRRRDEMRHAGDVVVMVERGVEAGGRFEQVCDHFLLFRAAHQPFLDRHVGRKSRQHGKLAGERLGRGNADLGPGMGGEEQVRLARHGTGGYIDDDPDGLAVLLAMAQRRQRIGRLAALGYEQRQAAFFEDGFAVAELARHIDVDRNAGELFEPVFRHHARIEGRTAGHDGDAAHAREIEIELRQRDRVVRSAQVGGERLRDHGRLLENLLLHEVAVIALFDRRGRCARSAHLAFDLGVLGVVDRRALARDNHPVAFLEVADLLRQRCKRQRVGAEIGFALAVTDHQRRTEPRADQHVGMVAKGNRQRKCTPQARQDFSDGFLRRAAFFHQLGDVMQDDFGIGIAFQRTPRLPQFGAQFLVILDNPVVDQRDTIGRMRVGVRGRGRTMRCPARVRDAHIACSRVRSEFGHEVRQLALCPATNKSAFVDSADAGAVVTAIFHALQAIDQPLHDRLVSDDPDNSAHRLKLRKWR